MTGWTFAGACGDHDRLEIAPGVNVWDYEWLAVMRDPPPPPTGDEWTDLCAAHETARVIDPNYGNAHEFKVYEIVDGARRIRFAAGEFSNTIFGFFLPRQE